MPQDTAEKTLEPQVSAAKSWMPHDTAEKTLEPHDTAEEHENIFVAETHDIFVAETHLCEWGPCSWISSFLTSTSCSQD